MKNILKLLFLSLAIYSCETDLDQVPENEIAASEKIDDVERIIFGSYAELKTAMNFEFNFGEIHSDNAKANNEDPWQSFESYDRTLIGNEILTDYWTALYKVISRANLAVNNVNDTDTELRGEAKFLRALAYFKLVRTFGDIPLITKSNIAADDNEALTRKPAADVYTLIINDLQDAAATLTTESYKDNDGRATSFSAKALLGKVYVYQKNYTAALPILKDVIDNSGASIADVTYAEVFDGSNELSNEVLFAIQYEGNIGTEDQLQQFTDLFLGAKDVNQMTDDLAAAFETGDTRLDAIRGSDGLTIKYGAEINLNSDWIELRLADTVLLYAEALNEQSTPEASTVTLPLLDAIRTRAGLAVLDPATLVTQADVRAAIKQERRVELAMENNRWYDLVRYGDAESILGITDPNFFVFPIPKSEIDASGGVITQNEAYR